MNVTAAVTLNSNLLIKAGGTLNINSSLSLGTAAGCGYYLAMQNGAVLDLGGTGSDRLVICGVELMKGGGACNNCGGPPNQGRCAYNGQPYCEPAGGFVDAFAWNQFGYNIALPITMLSFTVSAGTETVAIDWSTSMEENFSRFIVERSNDGRVFEPIGAVPAKGFNMYNIVSKYSFEDEAPLLGFNYYRLKAIDLDESFEYFGMKAIKFAAQKKIAVFPNPSIGDVISFRTNFGPEETDRIILTDQLGVEIFSSQASRIENNITFENPLKPGVYMLRYFSPDFNQTTKIIVCR
jgi:hypothetical protein